MSLTTWFTGPKQKRDSKPNNREHRPRRQPAHSRPSLETLEQRALLNAAGGLIDGSSGNIALNSNYNLASNGVILPIPGTARANGADPTHSYNSSGLAAGGPTADAASASFLAQDQPSAQFRLFAVNSQSESFRLFQTQNNILLDAYGFGSGTWPNRPWMPAAYNVGLGNHQFMYSSQADHGFSSVPPNVYPQSGTIPIAQSQPKKQQQRLDEEDGKAKEQPEQVLVRKSTLEQEESPRKRADKDINDQNEQKKPVREEEATEKKQSADQVLERDLSLPNSLWLSVLAPAPVTALVAGLPGEAAEADGGDSGPAAAE